MLVCRLALQAVAWVGNTALTSSDLSQMGTRHLNGYTGVSFMLKGSADPIALTHVGVYAARLCSNTVTRLQIDFWDVTLGERVSNSINLEIERVGGVTVAALVDDPIYIDSPDTYAITMYDSSHGVCQVNGLVCSFLATESALVAAHGENTKSIF